jgi:hypothetical protein
MLRRGLADQVTWVERGQVVALPVRTISPDDGGSGQK